MRRHSTVATGDVHLHKFFGACERVQRDGKLIAAIKGLHAVVPQELLRFFPILTNTLLGMLTDSTAAAGADSVSQQIMQYLIHACDVIHGETKREQVQILQAYVHDVFVPPPVNPTGRSVHGELVSYFRGCIGDRVAGSGVPEMAMRHSWFFFQLVAKSMAFGVASVATERESRFPKEYVPSLALHPFPNTRTILVHPHHARPN